ncbi:hypothetical protein E3U43_018816 [Larimichthys crocea]|nr:hypothetical protein E3U43_018816 [Larimichthys crocea]
MIDKRVQQVDRGLPLRDRQVRDRQVELMSLSDNLGFISSIRQQRPTQTR